MFDGREGHRSTLQGKVKEWSETGALDWFVFGLCQR